MGHPPGKCGQCTNGVGKGPAWGWLSAAAAGGVLAGRARGRFGVVIGVGLAAWCFWRTRMLQVAENGEEAAVEIPERLIEGVPLAQKAEQDFFQSNGPLPVSGVWLLNLEPMPSVVADEGNATASAVMGLGEDWLGQIPLLTSEEYDEAPSLVPQSEEAWLNGGAEIPDSVELPEV